jgi:DNA polymerase beta
MLILRKINLNFNVGENRHFKFDYYIFNDCQLIMSMVDAIQKELEEFTAKYRNIKIRVIISNMGKEDLIGQLQILIHKINADNAKAAVFKIKQYTDTIRLIETYPEKTISNLDKLTEWFKGNGKKNPKNMIDKISCYTKTGFIPNVQEAMSDPKVKAVVNLTKVANIGPAKAKQLYEKYDIITVDDLKNKYAEDKTIIHDKQRIGLQYHDDLIKRIPRVEMLEYNRALGNICKEISPDMKFSINGSFRRNTESSGDIDVLISGSKGTNKVLRNKFIKELKNRGIIVEVMASGSKKFMGIARLAPFKEYRHIDIIDTDIDQYPFAQLYFTGSGGFNSHMRLITLKKGYSLNEYCISDKKTKKPVLLAEIRKKLGKDRFEDEKDIFKFIDLEYVTPANRNTITLSKIL